ncbi:MAG: phage major capsid protein [Chloroflexi bacterium]|nr:phage major capsid protein [Chloroflexota bacterium]MDA1240827.1 phage major capsid protein [Chloroflexota bacterium]MQC19298.1 phage major capsid protein [Chloroflexota bacterium]
MTLTLAEGAKLSNDVLLEGVIETAVLESPVLQRLPFIEIVGNGLTYNRENAPASAGFYAVGDEWAEDTPTFTQATATLKILGGDADIDHYLARTRSNVQDLEAAVVALKAKAVQQAFDQAFITGDVTADTDSFDGLDRLCAAGQVVSAGDDGGPLSLSLLDELVDRVRGGKPEMLLMSRRTRRTLNTLARATGSGVVEQDRDALGRMVSYYDGIPIGVCDTIADDQEVGESEDCSSVYAVQFGEGALAGLTGPGGLTVERIGSLETKDAMRIRVKWYCALALFNELKLARLVGVRPAGE